MRHKEEKLVSLLAKVVANFFLRIDFKKILVSINRVELSKDSKIAKIYIGVYPDGNEAETLSTLKKKNKEIRKYALGQIRTRYLPHFEFIIDKGIKNLERMEEILQKVSGLVAK